MPGRMNPRSPQFRVHSGPFSTWFTKNAQCSRSKTNGSTARIGQENLGREPEPRCLGRGAQGSGLRSHPDRIRRRLQPRKPSRTRGPSPTQSVRARHRWSCVSTARHVHRGTFRLLSRTSRKTVPVSPRRPARGDFDRYWQGVFFDMLGVFAADETNLHRERQTEGTAAARQRGAHCGRHRKFGMDAIGVLLAEGPSPTGIAVDLWISRGTVYKAKDMSGEHDNPGSGPRVDFCGILPQ